MTIQKIIKGFDEKDLWNLDYHLAEIILPRLKAFKKSKGGYPAEFTSPAMWDETLDKMIWAFENVLRDNVDDSFEQDQENSIKEQEGLNLFATYFRYLWI